MELTSCSDWTFQARCKRSISRSINSRVNRIAVVKSVVAKFIDERPNDRIGLIAFAASPYIVSPLTLDHDWLLQNLERINVGIGDDGTAIGSAIAAAVNHLRTTTAKSKVVILLTDGVNNSGKISPLAAAEAARALGVKVYTIGVGVRGKAPIPVRDEAGKIHVIMANVDVDEKTLQAVASETGGLFYRATDTDSLQKIYEQINRYETSAQSVQKFEHVEELYRWALFPSLGLLGLGVHLAANEVSQVTVRFSDPNWLLAGLLTGVVLIGMWRRYDVRQQAALAKFVAPHLRLRLTGSVSGVGRFVQRGLFLASTLCLFAALAGPQLGYHWEKISRRGNEVVFAIDTSRSMLTPDVKPNRLTRAKLAIDDMARQLEGDGIGIVAFAGSAFLVCPLTLDYGAFHQSLDAVDVHTIPLGGTNISSAIETARAALRRRPGSDRILILVTDGENLEGNALTAAQEAAKQDGLKIYTVGIGTARGRSHSLTGGPGRRLRQG